MFCTNHRKHGGDNTDMTLTQQDLESILEMLKSAVITSAGNPDRAINRVTSVENLPVVSGGDQEGATEGIGGGRIGTGDIGTALQASRGGNIPALLSRFGSFAGIAAPVAAAFLIQPIAEQVINELQRPGGILDKRVKIDSRNEAFAELDRQTRQNTRIGQRQVIIQQFEGFRNFEGHASTNTSRMVRENADRVLDIGLFDRAQGV